MAGLGKAGTLLAPPEDLLVLERGTDEILLCHPLALEPVYMPAGRDFVRNLLAGIGGGVARERLYAANGGHRDLLMMLERHHILVDASRPYEPKPGRASRAGHELVSVYLTLTTACNLRCVYCLGKDASRLRAAEMAPDTARKALEKACRCVKPGGTLAVTFFGGEPLANWPLAKDIGEYVLQKLAPRYPDITFTLAMISNLAELPDDLAEWSLTHGMTFLCDVDGPPAIHDRLRPFAGGAGSWARVTENVRRLTSAGIAVGLRMTLTALNQGVMLETSRLFRQLGAKSCAFVPVQPVDIGGGFLAEELIPEIDVIVAGLRETYAAGVWGEDELFPLADYRRRMAAGGARSGPGCGSFAGQTPVVDADGTTYPCVYLVGDSRFRCGTAERDDAGGEARLAGLRERLAIDNLAECRRCPWRSLCGGGCSVPRLLIGPETAAPVKVRDYARSVNCAFVTAAYELLLWERSDRAYGALTGAGRPAARRAGGACC